MATNNKTIGIIVGACLLVGGIIALILIFSGGDDKNEVKVDPKDQGKKENQLVVVPPVVID